MTSARFRAGMVGAGNISEFHIHAVNALPGLVELVGVTDLDPARAEATAKKLHTKTYPSLDALVAAGRLERLAVGGLGDGWYAAPEDLDVAGDLAPGTRSTVLSPFDNLLCDRARAAELFGFDHRLEIYVPPAQRRWGYYVLPILHRERIVARADAAVDAGAGLLRVHALHREPGVRRSPALDRAVARALERLAAWRGVGEVSVVREA